MYIYEVGGNYLTEQVTVWSDKAKAAPISQPVELDSAGEAQIWFDGTVDIRVEKSDTTLLYTMTGIESSPTATITGNYNLVQNGDFELDNDNDGTPDNWTLLTNTNGTVELDLSSGGQNSGLSGLKFASVDTGGGTATSEKFSVTANSYVLNSFSFKQLDAATGTYSYVINWYQYDGTASSVSAATTVWQSTTDAPTTWTIYNNTVSVPSDATYGEVVLTGLGTGGSDLTGSCWFDAVACSVSSSSTKTLLASSSASAVASVLFTDVFDAPRYHEYELVFNNVVPAVNAENLVLSFSDDSNVTWDWINTVLLVGNTAARGDGTCRIYGAYDAGVTNTLVDSICGTARLDTGWTNVGVFEFDSLRIAFTGNITSGEFYLYGINPV